MNWSRYQFSGKTDNFQFSDQISVYLIYNRKSQHRHSLPGIRISLSSKLHLKLNLLHKFTPKKVFAVKNRKNKHHSWIVHIRIKLETKFYFKQTILIFVNQIYRKGYFQFKTQNLKTGHWVLQIQISVCTKFHLKLSILIFGPNLPKNCVFDLKQNKLTPPLNSADSCFSFFFPFSKISALPK